MARTFMVHPDRRSWAPAAVWAGFAIASVSAAVWVALRPGHLQDLHLVRVWLAYIQHHSADPYAYFAGELDYPPIAFLVLWPLGWIPDAQLTAWFLPFGIGISILASWAFVGAVADRVGVRLTAAQRVALVSLTLSSSSVRGAIWLGQTVSLAVLFGALALLWSRRRPFAAALMLAACSFKPHIAFGFGLAILLIDGPDVIVIALAMVLSASLIVAAALNEWLLTIFASYARNLLTMYNGPDRITGMLSVRWVLDEVTGNYGLGTALYAALAVASLVLIGAAARRARDAAGRAQVIAAALLWPVLFLPSQLYNGVLAGPAIWLLMWAEGGSGIRLYRRLALVASFVLVGVVDVARLLRFLGEWLDDAYWLFKGSYYLNPIRFLLLFCLMLFIAFRRTRRTPPEVSA
jgi:hypothetical protein